MFSSVTVLILFIATALNLVYCDVYRLPHHIKPIRYYLTMEPHLRDTKIWEPISYQGSVVIEVQVLENTRNVTFHQVNLEIEKSSITIVSSNGKNVGLSATSEDGDTETYTIQWENELVKGENYNFTIGNFTGYLGRGEGFFRAFYWKDDEPRGLAATHFEPTGARRAFPCFDEPSLKARFVVSLIRKEGYTSVSNEDLATTEDLGNGLYKDTFKETPIMPTFTLAFAVSDYKSSEKLGKHRILARPEAIDNGDWKFSLDIANKTLIALEEYTGIDFVIDKMDQIAIPDGYFHEHAMENWGLVVYGESHLMRNNGSRATDYMRSACYIAHEFAHQWFGNLVTPAWWDYLWISESFAAYFQYHIADIVEPSWRLKEKFLVDMVQVALVREEKRGAYPLNYKIQYSGQYAPFHIMYEKGSSIIRMVEHFLTHDVFRRGLQIYLEKNKFSNAMPSDVYAALQEAVDKAGVNNLLDNMTVAEIMQTWDSNKGFPIVTVTRDYETGSITLEQKPRFPEDDNSTITKWKIPMNYVFSARGKLDFAKTAADFWLTEEKAVVNHSFPTDGWLIVNKQETGYYRVNYDLQNWERIISTLNSDDFKSINVLNRAQLIDDAFNLASLGHLPWEIPLRLGQYVIRERDYIALNPFYYALNSYVYIYDYGKGHRESKSFKYFGNYSLINQISTKHRTEYEVYEEYITTTLAGIKDSLGFEAKPDDTFLDEIHRASLRDFINYF